MPALYPCAKLDQVQMRAARDPGSAAAPAAAEANSCWGVSGYDHLAKMGEP